jgi:hypothetical protein
MDNTHNKLLVVIYVIWMEKKALVAGAQVQLRYPLCVSQYSIAVLVAAFYWLEEYPSDTMANRLRHKRCETRKARVVRTCQYEKSRSR